MGAPSKRARQPRRAKAAGKLPDKAPIVTSAANPHYQKRFDELHKLAAAGDWAAVRDYRICGSNSYSKLIARYQQDLLWSGAPGPRRLDTLRRSREIGVDFLDSSDAY